MGIEEFAQFHRDKIMEFMPKMEGVDEKNARLAAIKKELYGQIVHLDSDKKELIRPYVIAAEGIRLFNELGKVVTAADFGMKFDAMPDNWGLAKELETWLYYYKEMYREVSKETELGRIQALVCWYGDYLRERSH